MSKKNKFDKADLEAFLKDNELVFRRDSDNIQANCPLCTDQRFRLGIRIEPSDKKDEDHHWHCFNCNSSGKKLRTLAKAMGSLKDLKRSEFVEYKDDEKAKIDPELGDICYKRLKESPEAIKYLIKERKLSKDCIKHFKVGFRYEFINKDGEEYDAGPHIAIPYWERGKCVNLKYRSIDPFVDKKMKWRREKGGKTALFNIDCLDDMEFDDCFITEAEIDCMSVWTNGFHNVVSVTAGANNDFEKNFKQEWYDKLERFKRIYILMDNDKDGQAGARKLAARLGLHRCYNIVLPEDTKDPNDYFMKYSAEDFELLKKSAKLFEVENVRNLTNTAKDYLERLMNGDEDVSGYQTEWPRMNKVMGYAQPGNLVVISAKPKVGKTTFALNWLKFLGLEGVTSFNYQCEMSAEDLLLKYVSMESVIPLPDPNEFEKGSKEHKDALETRKRLIQSTLVKLPRNNLFSYHPTMDELEVDQVIKKCTEAVQRFGAKVVVIDNLHFLCRGDNEREQVDIATRAFKAMAVTLGIVVILITHPRKTNHNKALSNDDLKGSSAIFQDADLVVLMHREYENTDKLPDEDEDEDDGALSPLTEFKITARRHKGGRCKLVFSGDFSKFKDHGDLFNSQMEKIMDKADKKKKRQKASV